MTEYEFIGDSTSDLPREISPWEAFANHREIISGMIKSSAPPFAQSLAVLGAGFCNDIDLNQIINEFDEVALYDIRLEDMKQGLEFQGLPNESKIKLVEFELSGLDSKLDSYRSNQNEYDLDQILNSTPPSLPEKHDCIISTCLLSQLLHAAYQAIGENHDRFVDLLRLVRQQHIELMLNALNPSGTGILVTDFVSTESLPELFTTTDLKKTIGAAVDSQNYLHGLNPSMVAQTFSAPHLKPRLANIKVTDPWRWAMPNRIYACFAIIFQRRSNAEM